ncbi:Ig-like domain-containing protein [Mycobacterium sp. CVI_P3]|uniref:Ig-like domain-containing protein n=1 Tax=Mycobacterium pinniadriaticum TaxID=2994102 RepID=A0ABT3SG82_9MYCO|nr:Ig-like domain-containing protein [Mycobacterium pinniadriaticum]MCX2932097.1 Ig-like domain-containing protein [Mycobacterium pinniadriaticum]MCX2938521.1 Ig-like domain-containing protein [Mycobacterium pinniadriaticum]
MSSTRYGARAGAATFALGLGIAMANGGVAVASPSDSGSAAGSSSSAGAKNSGTGSSSRARAAHASTAGSGGHAGANPKTAATSDSGVTAVTEPSDAVSVTPEAIEPAEADGGAPGTAHHGKGLASSRVHSRDSADPVVAVAVTEEPGSDGTDDASAAADATDVDTTSVTPERDAGVAPAGAVTIADSAADTAASVTPAATITTSPMVKALQSAATTLFDWTKLPTGENPLSLLFAGAVEFMRRTFFNQTPTATPVQYAQLEDGDVVGTLGASDPEGGKLVYSLAQAPNPTYGTVEIDEEGNYFFTPSAAYAVNGGTTSFVVEVREPGFHINLLNPFAHNRIYVPVTVSLTPVEGAEDLQSTRGFTVYNFSSGTVTFTGFKDDQAEGIESGPTIGTQIGIGESVHWEIDVPTLIDNDVYPTFTAGGESWTAYLVSHNWTGVGTTWCDASGASCNADQEHLTVYLLAAPNTVVPLPVSSTEQQKEVLEGLCHDGSVATCSFTPTSQTETWTDWKFLGSKITNDSDTEDEYDITREIINTYSDSVKLSAKAKASIAKIVDIEISAEYGHTWTESYKWSETVKGKIPPHSSISYVERTPTYSVQGDFTLHVGNTTWQLTGVTLTSADSSGDRQPEVKKVLGSISDDGSSTLESYLAQGHELGDLFDDPVLSDGDVSNFELTPLAAGDDGYDGWALYGPWDTTVL